MECPSKALNHMPDGLNDFAGASSVKHYSVLATPRLKPELRGKTGDISVDNEVDHSQHLPADHHRVCVSVFHSDEHDQDGLPADLSAKQVESRFALLRRTPHHEFQMDHLPLPAVFLD